MQVLGRGCAKLLTLGVVSVVLGRPAPALSQALKQADLVGTWRNVLVHGVALAPATGALSLHPGALWYAVRTLRSDGSFISVDRWVVRSDSTVESEHEGPWSLAGDTLVVQWKSEPESRDKVSLNGTMLVVHSQDRVIEWFTAWERVDTTKPLPPLAPATPPTLQRADLVGTWVAKTTRYGNTVVDTVVLRADSTWVAPGKITIKDGERIISTGDKSGRDKEVNAGRWYLGPVNTVLFTDPLGQKVYGNGYCWRGDGNVVLHGQQLITDSGNLYTRVSTSTP